MATRSMPTVSCLLKAKASLSLVPTPSVDETSTGSLMLPISGLNRPPNPPMSEMTPLVCVRCTRCLMRATRSLPAWISTPASVYAFARSVDMSILLGGRHPSKKFAESQAAFWGKSRQGEIFGHLFSRGSRDFPLIYRSGGLPVFFGRQGRVRTWRMTVRCRW